MEQVTKTANNMDGAYPTTGCHDYLRKVHIEMKLAIGKKSSRQLNLFHIPNMQLSPIPEQENSSETKSQTLTKTIRTIFLAIILLAQFSCHQTEEKQSATAMEPIQVAPQDYPFDSLFSDCDNYKDTAEYKTLSHPKFDLVVPTNWEKDFEMNQGIDISSRDFPDSLARGFTLSVVSADFYSGFKKNPLINYYNYVEGTTMERKSIFLIRNDLFPSADRTTVYWRGELKIMDRNETNVFLLLFGKRHDRKKEPSWCEFEKIINSLKIKD